MPSCFRRGVKRVRQLVKGTDFVSALFDTRAGFGENKRTLCGALLTWVSLAVISAFLIGSLTPHSQYPATLYSDWAIDTHAQNVTTLPDPELKIALLVSKSVDSNFIGYATESDFQMIQVQIAQYTQLYGFEQQEVIPFALCGDKDADAFHLRNDQARANLYCPQKAPTLARSLDGDMEQYFKVTITQLIAIPQNPYRYSVSLVTASSQFDGAESMQELYVNENVTLTPYTQQFTGTVVPGFQREMQLVANRVALRSGQRSFLSVLQTHEARVADEGLQVQEGCALLTSNQQLSLVSVVVRRSLYARQYLVLRRTSFDEVAFALARFGGLITLLYIILKVTYSNYLDFRVLRSLVHRVFIIDPEAHNAREGKANAREGGGGGGDARNWWDIWRESSAELAHEYEKNQQVAVEQLYAIKGRDQYHYLRYLRLRVRQAVLSCLRRSETEALRSDPTAALYHIAECKIRQDLRTSSVVKKLYDIDKFKLLLIDVEHIPLFNSVTRPVISRSNVLGDGALSQQTRQSQAPAKAVAAAPARQGTASSAATPKRSRCLRRLCPCRKRDSDTPSSINNNNNNNQRDGGHAQGAQPAPPQTKNAQHPPQPQLQRYYRNRPQGTQNSKNASHGAQSLSQVPPDPHAQTLPQGAQRAQAEPVKLNANQVQQQQQQLQLSQKQQKRPISQWPSQQQSQLLEARKSIAPQEASHVQSRSPYNGGGGGAVAAGAENASNMPGLADSIHMDNRSVGEYTEYQLSPSDRNILTSSDFFIAQKEITTVRELAAAYKLLVSGYSSKMSVNYELLRLIQRNQKVFATLDMLQQLEECKDYESRRLSFEDAPEKFRPVPHPEFVINGIVGAGGANGGHSNGGGGVALALSRAGSIAGLQQEAPKSADRLPSVEGSQHGGNNVKEQNIAISDVRHIDLLVVAPQHQQLQQLQRNQEQHQQSAMNDEKGVRAGGVRIEMQDKAALNSKSNNNECDDEGAAINKDAEIRQTRNDNV